jgi:hypothetical protein
MKAVKTFVYLNANHSLQNEYPLDGIFLDTRLKGAWFIRHVDEVRNSMLINHKGTGNLYGKEALGLWPTKLGGGKWQSRLLLQGR